MKKNLLTLFFIMLIMICFNANVEAATCSKAIDGKTCGTTLVEVYDVTTDSLHIGHYSCPKCGYYSLTGSVQGNHTFGSWTSNGYGVSHSRTCSKCNYKQTESHTYGAWKKTNENQHRRDCSKCNSYGIENHTTTTAATCTAAAYCGTCKSNFGSALGHSTPSTYSSNTTQHWKLCARGCGTYVYNKENHYDNNNDGKCDVCGYLMDKIPPVISFSPDGNSTKARTHSTVVSVTDEGGSGLSTCKYVWTTSSEAPTSASGFTTTFSAGNTISTPTASGTYYLHVYAIDGSNNYKISSSKGFVLDNTAPTGTVKINNGATYTDTASVTLNLTASSDTAQVAISNTTTKGSYQTYALSKSWTLTATEGSKTVYVWFKDNVGNESGMYSASIILDLANPELGTITLEPTTHTITGTVTGATDNASGIKNYDYYLNNVLSGSEKPFKYTYTGLTPNTRYNCTYLVRDNVNKTSAISAAKYKYTLAMIPKNVVASNGTSDTSITISWDANGNPSGTTYSIDYTEDGITWTNLRTLTTTTYTHTGLVQNKTYQYRVKAINHENISTNYSGAATGKTTPKVASDNIILDLEAPVITLTKNKDATTGAEISITVNVQETYEINALKYIWTTSSTKLTSESEFTGGSILPGETISPPSNLAKGTCYLQVYASDMAGNSSIETKDFINIPVINEGSILINNGDEYTKSTNVTLKLYADSAEYMYLTDNAVAINSIPNSSWIAYNTSANFTVSAINGEKTVYAYYKDIFGNILSVYDTIILDTIAPGIGDMTGTQYKNTASGGTVSVSASGFTDYEGSGISHCNWYYRINTGSWSSLTRGTISAGKSTFNVPITTEGNYTVRIWLYDKAGNSSYKDTTIILDRTPPVIGNITGAQTLNLVNGEKVTIAASNFTDAGGSGVDHCTWQYKLGTGSLSTAVLGSIKNNISEYTITINNDGTYTVRITLYDKAGNSSYKETTVQIDHTAPSLGTLTLTATTNSITATVTGASDNVQVEGYEFYIDGAFAAKQESNVFTFGNLNCSTAYDITYKVYDIFGNYTDMSPISKKYTLANVPINLEASDDWSPTKIMVKWENNGNAEDVAYEVIASDDSITWSAPIYVGTELECIHKDLEIDTKKYYKVRARNQEGIYTEYSNIDSGKTISDIVPPLVYIERAENITLGIEDFAKKTDDVRLIIRCVDDAYASSSLTVDDITILVNFEEITPTIKQIESITNIEDGIEISLLLKGIVEDGLIMVGIPEGKFLDTTGNKNEEVCLASGMIADNIPPELNVENYPAEEILEGYYVDISASDLNGISKVTINGEEITLDENGNYKYYTEQNGNYEVIVTDPAMNKTIQNSVITEIDLGKSLKVKYKIPVDLDGSGLGTTIKIPIPSNGVNNYLVVWGDGTFNRYAKEDFPTHTYTNTEETSYIVRIQGRVESFGYYNLVAPTATNIYSDYYTFTKYVTEILQWGKLGASRYGFAHCSNLSGSIPESVGFEKLVSVENMFLNCTSLTGPISENLLNQATEINSAKNMFMNCENITGEIPAELFKNNTKITTFENTFNNCKGLGGEIPSTLFENATEVRTYAGTFSGCTNLTGVIPERLFENSIKVSTFKETFANCVNIVSPTNADGIVIAVPEKLFKNNKYVLNYYRTFYNCTGLTGNVNDKIFDSNSVILEIPEDETVNNNYRGTFEGCTGIEKVELKSLIIGHEMFKNCTNLESVKLSKIIDIGNEAFYGCNILTDIQVLDDYLQSIGTDAFEYTGITPDKLVTYINQENKMLSEYVWIDDNRIVDMEAPKGTVEIVTDKYPFTKDRIVNLLITVTDDYSAPENCQMAIINEDMYNSLLDYEDLTWQSYTSDVEWTLTPNDDVKTVWVFFKDECGNISKVKKDIAY